MKTSPHGSQRGFTLLEALVSMAIFTAALTAVLVTFSSSKELFVRGQRKVQIQQSARWAMAEMSQQLRMAGYFPENFATPPPSPLLGNPVRVATDGYLAFHGDADNSGASNVFVYCLEGETLRLGRGATTSAAAYQCANGAILAENVIDLRFSFYDDAGQSIPNPAGLSYALDAQQAGTVPSMTDTTQRDQVRRVLVTLAVRGELRLNQEQHYTLTSDIELRNAE